VGGLTTVEIQHFALDLAPSDRYQLFSFNKLLIGGESGFELSPLL
jgi:hypothetical protein